MLLPESVYFIRLHCVSGPSDDSSCHGLTSLLFFKQAADSSTPAHVASNASSDAFPPPPTAALPQFALEKAGVQGAPSMRVNPAPVYGGPPSTSGPSSFGFGAGVGDSTLEKRGGTETPSAPSTSLPPLAQSSPGFGFQNSLNSNGIPAAQPCNGPKNAPTSFFTPSTGADTNVSLKIGDNSGSLVSDSELKSKMIISSFVLVESCLDFCSSILCQLCTSTQKSAQE